MESLIVYATARAAMLCYLATLAALVAWPAAAERRVWSRPVWVLGAVLMAIHLAAAFAGVHHWSHESAYDATAQQTGDTFGWYWGGGIYLNYLLILLWLGDAAWWTAAAESYEARPGWIDVMCQAFFAMMVVNGALVFATWTGRAIFLGGGLVLLIAALVVRSRPSHEPS